ncbi:hypothetical protein KXD40_001121 [Peronospora effusa]|nr:hypothetical protein KXD40_001121 [Peronospora effusa]
MNRSLGDYTAFQAMTGRIIRRRNDLVIVASVMARNGWESFEKHATYSVIIKYKNIVLKLVVPIHGNSERRINMKCLNTAMYGVARCAGVIDWSMEYRIIYDYRDMI